MVGGCGERRREPCRARADLGYNRSAVNPSRKTPDAEANVVAALSVGKTLRAAAGDAGVSHETVRNWCKADPDFAERVEVAKLQGQSVLEGRALDPDVTGPSANVIRHRLSRMDVDGWGEVVVNVDGGRATLADLMREDAERG